jgi:hypothetical protein
MFRRNEQQLLVNIFGLLLAICAYPFFVHAAMLTRVSDTISDSAPGATTTNHTLLFSASTSIPLGGSIVISPETMSGDAFTVPALLDYSDVDLSYATTGAYVDRPLYSSANGIADGVDVVSGTAGTITITLGDAVLGAIPANAHIMVKIGDHATYEAVGDSYIENPTGIHAYRVRIATYGGVNIPLDSGVAMIAIASPVSVGPVDTTDLVVPIRTNGMPIGEILGSTQAVQISLNTNKDSVCKFDTTAGIIFPTMSATMTSANYGFLHYYTITGLTASTTYSYYVRCMNTSGVYNPDDYPIIFNTGEPVYPGSNATNSGVAANTLNTNTTGPLNIPPGASSFSGPGPAGGPYLGQGQVTIDGESFPSAKIVYLKDGKVVKEDTVDSTGHINQQFIGLERGTYTWGIYVIDPNGKNSGTVNSTIYLIGNSNNIIAPVYTSPTISGTSTVGLGENTFVEGYAVPKKVVQVITNKRGDVLNAKIITATTTTSASGKYRVEIPTETFSKGTYEIKAQTVIDNKNFTSFSPTIYLGVGESPKVDFTLRADLNKDKKVNIVDFSILLFNWKTSDPVADINQDGMVNLTDFSIMLANWTG